MKKLFKLVAVITAIILSPAAKAQVPSLSSYPSAQATIYLDFDGQTVTGTFWNSPAYQSIVALPASPALSSANITEIFNRVAEDYRPFNINVTTDSTVFLAAPSERRMRVIITSTSAWYGTSAGGAAFTNSFTWNNNTPCFVFADLLFNSRKNIAEACSHEAGHTFGLFHQSAYTASCVKTEYHPGNGLGEIGWAPIMGNSYSKNLSTWSNGTSSNGCTLLQDDMSVIANATNGFGYRTDDHSGNASTATNVVVNSGAFTLNGLVNNITDKDIFKLVLTGASNIKLNAIPYNVGLNNAGANIDIQVNIVNATMDTVGKYNPSTALNVGVDTILSAGTYYFVVDGVGNANTTDYGSLGFYTITGTQTPVSVLPLRRLELKGNAGDDRHNLSWVIEADEPVKNIEIQYSPDGRQFVPLANTTGSNYAYRPNSASTITYRLKVTFINDNYYYSNIIALRQVKGAKKVELTSNMVSDELMMNSKGNYKYQLADVSGKVLASGQITDGYNKIKLTSLTRGIYFIRFMDGAEQWTEKLIK
jgi:hypothetical protein